MKPQTNSFLNWANNTNFKSNTIYPSNTIHLKKIVSKKYFICAGNQRSYGDTAINSNCIVSMKKFNKVISFDKKKGIIDLQSGILLSEVLSLIVPKGWFFPVTPGTKYVSIGGMIANNIHGKKTARNQFKYYIKEFKLMLSSKKIITCSPIKNKKIFDLTIGGFGLTGVILSAKISLKKIKSTYIDQKIMKFDTYNQFFSHLELSKNFDYCVNWIENFSFKKIKGLSYFGNHSKQEGINNLKPKDKKLSFLNFYFLKLFTQNYYFSKILNFFFSIFKSKFYRKKINLYDFFYPQDKFLDWNRIYSSGFVQIQFLIKKKDLRIILNEISIFLNKMKKFSPFIVIKNYKEKGSHLNFTGEGISISMDIHIDQDFKKIKSFFNNIFLKYSLTINFSKDFITEKKVIKKNKKFLKFKSEINKINKESKFRSSFSRRLGL